MIHMVMEAKKSHSLPRVSCGTRTAKEHQSESEALRSWGANCVKRKPKPKSLGEKCQEENQEH